MKTIDDILSSEEKEVYTQGWKSMTGKYSKLPPCDVHSGFPVLGRVYRYPGTKIFRSHVFSRRMRRVDPYHLASECLQPFWHAQHYLLVAEQMYMACAQLLLGEECNHLMAKDVPVEFSWKKSILWNDTISVELIREDLGTVGRYQREIGYFTFYSDRSGIVLSRMSAESYWTPRAYVKDMTLIRSGDAKAVDDLERKIRARETALKRLNPPRKQVLSSSAELIDCLRKGILLEKEIHDYFSNFDSAEE